MMRTNVMTAKMKKMFSLKNSNQKNVFNFLKKGEDKS
tara:strand:+ start:153 stop:263 length:111 start_codon:yes stop_codon:yes gene_type:complete